MKFLYLIIFSLFFAHNSFAEQCKGEYAALVMNAKTGKVLYHERAEDFKYPASLAKLMTLYLTFEAIEDGKLSMNQKLLVSKRAESQPRSKLYLKEGETISVKKAISGIIVKSFNDVAVVLGEAIAGDEWRFANMMNMKAKELGMYHTSFRNASGLHDNAQFSTAFDMAKLAIAIQKRFPSYYSHFAETKFQYNGEKFKTHNYVLLDYKKATGMKTGFTNAAGFNLVTSAHEKNKNIISIIMSCEDYTVRDSFAIELLESAFKKMSRG